ncbi:MAG TPA: SIMPL domain-containing protein [Acidimicrobiales bacterium]|nr:SIMPL domain-containing protein [Acidimicrobiales bacterium]
MEREIVVRGTGEARALPDRASVTVEVTADRKTQDEAYDARTKLAARVDSVLEQHANAIDRTTIASLVVRPRTRWHRGEDIRTGWQASRTSFVDIVVLDALGDIMAGLVDAGAAVHGPRWSMAPSNPAYDQARRIAAEDARRRAEAYAAALGLSLGPVAWVAEPGLRGNTAPPSPMVRAVAMSAAAPADAEAEPEGENLTPAEMTVEVEVEVGFMILDAAGQYDVALDIE